MYHRYHSRSLAGLARASSTPGWCPTWTRVPGVSPYPTKYYDRVAFGRRVTEAQSGIGTDILTKQAPGLWPQPLLTPLATRSRRLPNASEHIGTHTWRQRHMVPCTTSWTTPLGDELFRSRRETHVHLNTIRRPSGQNASAAPTAAPTIARQWLRSILGQRQGRSTNGWLPGAKGARAAPSTKNSRKKLVDIRMAAYQ